MLTRQGSGRLDKPRRASTGGEDESVAPGPSLLTGRRAMSVGGLEQPPAVEINKENRAPPQHKMKKIAVRPPSPGQGGEKPAPAEKQLSKSVPSVPSLKDLGSTGCSTPAPPCALSAGDSVARQTPRAAQTPRRCGDLETAAQLEHVREEMRKKTLQLRERDRKLEDLLRRNEELSHDRKEAHRKATEAEADRDKHRRQAYDREQELLNHQRRSENYRSAVEERMRRSTHRDDDHAVAEVQKLKRHIEELERARKAERSQDERAGAGVQKLRRDMEQLQERLAVADRDAEAARSASQASQATTQAALDAKKKAEDRLAAAEKDAEAARREAKACAVAGKAEAAADAKLKERLAVAEKDAEAIRREAKASASKAEAALDAKFLDRLAALTREAEAARGEARASASRAEAALEGQRRAEESLLTKGREIAAEAARLTGIEEDRRRQSDERQREMQQQLEGLQKQTKHLEKDLAAERERCEGLERLTAAVSAARHEPSSHNAAALADFELERERRARQAAEAEAEAANDELRHWKEWADEQQLRELLTETQKLEEFKRVRDDVTRQVEDAKAQTGDENRDLRRRVAEVEGELIQCRIEFDGKRLDLYEAQSRAEEERRALEARVARADAARAVAEEEQLEERQRCEALENSLRSEREAALEARGEEQRTALEAEREAARLRESAAEVALRELRGECSALRWRALADGVAGRRAAEAEAEHGAWVQVRRAAKQWREAARCQERDAGMVERQAEELERLDGEAEGVRSENAQLLSSVQQLQQELQSSLAEMRRLQELEETYEVDVLKVSDRNAELAGHTNHKQKIQYLNTMKAENQTLRDEVRRAKQQATQMECKLRSAHFYNEVMSAPTSGGGSAASGAFLSEGGKCRTPARARTSTAPHAVAATPGHELVGASAASGLASGDAEEATLRRERSEAARQVRYHRRASERATAEFLHLAALVEQVLAVKPPASASAGAAATSAAAAATSVAGAAGAAAGDSAAAAAPALYRRLRELATSLSGAADKQADTSTVPRTPTKAKGRGDAVEPELEASPPGRARP